MWSRGVDSFTGVRFPEAGVRDIRWSSLEITDEGYLRQREEARQKKREALRTATDVVLHLGPNGGFRGLSCRYEIDGHTNHETMGRESAEEALALFKEYGIPVKEERALRQNRYR